MKQAIIYQRVESVCVFAAVVYFYAHMHFMLIWLVVLFLAIDIFMVGYLVDNKVGAHVYNAAHSYIIPTVLVVLGASLSSRPALALGLIWTAHIALDRAMGYGLKFETGFQDTHLGKIGEK